MNRTRILTLIGLLAPFLAGAGALDAYALLTGKTVLAPATLPALPDSVVPDSLTDTNKAIAAIETALAEKGLEVVQDGPHFVRVFPKAARDFMTNAPLRGAQLAPAKGQGLFPTGIIDFSPADLCQVLDIYAVMRQRTILRSAILPGSAVRLKTTCPLTQAEAMYAMETVLALNGICLVDDGAKFVQAVPMAQRSAVQAHAPKPEPGAKLFEPKKGPSMGVSNSYQPLTERERLEQEFEKLRKAFYEFVHLPDPAKRSAQRLCCPRGWAMR